jgi:hypothetical protein
VGHLRDHGFEVEVIDVPNLGALQAERGVPAGLRGCHSAMADGYVVEGHVPADLLERFLEEDSDLMGISVPGMPPGAPGMESLNPVAYDVVVFDHQGRSTVYDSR